MFINIKPADKFTVYETAEQAIRHVFIFRLWAKTWKQTKSFGQSMAEWRKIDTAIQAKDITAFKASKRRGYWVVELAA
jgi:hypothetical protein